MKHTSRLPALLLVALVGLGLLASCGTTEDTEPAAGDGPASTDPVTVTDARGEVVTLPDGPASKVVALEWMEAENLVTLGVMPIGVADVAGYGTWNRAAPLDDTVADVGMRTEPNDDAILDLEPDLVIVEGEDHQALVDHLERYVPVIVTKGSDASDNLQQMRATFELIAEAVGKEDVAAEVLGDLEAKIADTEAALAEAGLAGEQFMLADGYLQGSSLIVRVFARGSLMSDLAEAVGLVNGWEPEGDAEWGLATTDLEGLTTVDDLHFFYSASDQDPIADGTIDSPIFDTLPFVQSGQVHKLDPGTWTFGGPASSSRFLDQLVDKLAP